MELVITDKLHLHHLAAFSGEDYGECKHFDQRLGIITKYFFKPVFYFNIA